MVFDYDEDGEVVGIEVEHFWRGLSIKIDRLSSTTDYLKNFYLGSMPSEKHKL